MWVGATDSSVVKCLLVRSLGPLSENTPGTVSVSMLKPLTVD